MNSRSCWASDDKSGSLMAKLSLVDSKDEESLQLLVASTEKQKLVLQLAE